MDNFLLGYTIRRARMKMGYSQAAFSEMLDISPIHLANIEGGRRNPSVPLLFRMMELLDFSVDALVFQRNGHENILHTDGLTEDEQEALSRLVDAIKQGKAAAK